MGVLSLKRKLGRLLPVLPTLVEETLNQLAPEIVKLNQEQLAEGQRSDGSKMPLYKPITKQRKQEEGRTLTGDRISLIDKGDFWKSFFVKAENGKLLFDATDRKTEELIKTYGELVFGLSGIQKEALAELAKPILYEKILKYLRQ